MLFLERVFDLAELLENSLVMFGRNADACIGDAELHPLIRQDLRRHRHASVRRELQCVGDEISQNLRDLALVRVQGANAPLASSNARSTPKCYSARSGLSIPLRALKSLMYFESLWGECESCRPQLLPDREDR